MYYMPGLNHAVYKVTRRELDHALAQVLDQVMTTGEPVEVITRGGRPLIIAVKSESTYEQWVREGLVADRVPDVAALDAIEPIDIGRPTGDLLAEIRGERCSADR